MYDWFVRWFVRDGEFALRRVGRDEFMETWSVDKGFTSSPLTLGEVQTLCAHALGVYAGELGMDYVDEEYLREYGYGIRWEARSSELYFEVVSAHEVVWQFVLSDTHVNDVLNTAHSLSRYIHERV